MVTSDLSRETDAATDSSIAAFVSLHKLEVEFRPLLK